MKRAEQVRPFGSPLLTDKGLGVAPLKGGALMDARQQTGNRQRHKGNEVKTAQRIALSLGQCRLVAKPAAVYSETGRTQWLEGTNTEGEEEAEEGRQLRLNSGLSSGLRRTAKTGES